MRALVQASPARVVVALVGLAAAHVAWPGAASAYNCLTTTCSPYCMTPVPYRLGAPSADLGIDVSEVELKKSFEAWTAFDCTNLKVQYGGRTEEAAGNANGVVAWVEQGWANGSGVIGTTTSRGGRNCLTAHMRLNGVNFKWVTGTNQRGEVNTFSIVAHEAGHYLGLGHTNVSGALMFPSYRGGILPVAPDDQAGICKIYAGMGGGAVPAADCTTRGCPAGFVCDGNVCRSTSDAGAPGAGGGGGGRDGGSTSGLVRDAGTSPVTPTPTPAPTPAPAPVRLDAAAPSAPPTGSTPGATPAPAPGAKPPANVARADGEPCQTGDDCRSNLCLEMAGRSVCSRICTGNGDCASGFVCKDLRGDSVCVPSRASVGDGGVSSSEVAPAVTSGCRVAPRGGRESSVVFGAGLVALALVVRARRRGAR